MNTDVETINGFRLAAEALILDCILVPRQAPRGGVAIGLGIS